MDLRSKRALLLRQTHIRRSFQVLPSSEHPHRSWTPFLLVRTKFPAHPQRAVAHIEVQQRPGATQEGAALYETGKTKFCFLGIPEFFSFVFFFSFLKPGKTDLLRHLRREHSETERRVRDVEGGRSKQLL